ncbi:ATP-binding protein [Sphingomonas sp. LR60]|uniref:ATP-binding protein n=1 Tax=Sphingomonas sp. LR60 TaxID=3050233 RepID=UPI002FE1E431
MQPALENRYRHKDGSHRTISWVAAPAHDLIYATGRDVTEAQEAAKALRRAEEQLRQAQKVEAVGQLTGGVAHDFNNLLTVIRGSVDLLRRPGLSDEKRERYVSAIAETADRATKLTSQLLAFARRQALKPEVFDVGDSIRALVDMVGTLAGSRITIATELGERRCFINADRSQFDTSIVNMAVNARDAMSGEGKLTIAVAQVTGMPALRTHPAVPGEFITISITDSGTGIPEDKIDRIFEPFFTTKGVGEGTGLGLSQVFGFAKQSGGDVVVESTVGHGATFTLYLPRAVEPEALKTAVNNEAAQTIGEGACILVVEDNVEVGTFATAALAELGCETVLAMDGPSALVELGTNGERFDVVFSDVVMPGMSGVELAQELRRKYPALPIILTSGYSNVLAKNGTDGFEMLHKPYSIDELSCALRKVSDLRKPRL